MNDGDNVVPISETVNQFREWLITTDIRGGASGGGGGMDERLSRLESQFDTLRDDNTRIREQLATLTERVAHLPSKGFIVNALLLSLAVVAGLITFGGRLQALVTPHDAEQTASEAAAEQ